MTDQSKRCTKCGEDKPLAGYYLLRAAEPDGPRRADCKACHSADGARRRAEGGSLIAELIRVGINNYDAMSERARAAVFTEEPLDPALVAQWQAQTAKEAKRKARAARKRERELALGLRPWGFEVAKEYR